MVQQRGHHAAIQNHGRSSTRQHPIAASAGGVHEDGSATRPDSIEQCAHEGGAVGDNDYFFVARGEMVVCLCCPPRVGAASSQDLEFFFEYLDPLK